MYKCLCIHIYIDRYIYIYGKLIGAGQVAGAGHDGHGIRRGLMARPLHCLGRPATCVSEQHGAPPRFLRRHDALPAALPGWPGLL